MGSRAHRHRPDGPPDVRPLRRAVNAAWSRSRSPTTSIPRRDDRRAAPARRDIDARSYEHGRAQNAIRNLRNAYVELLAASSASPRSATATRRIKLAAEARDVRVWVGYDLDGRTDIALEHSRSILRLQEKRASLADIRERFLGLKHELAGGDEAQRIARQITGKLDLAIAAVDEQVEALGKVMTTDTPGLAKPPTSSPARTATTLLTVEPLSDAVRR